MKCLCVCKFTGFNRTLQSANTHRARPAKPTNQICSHRPGHKCKLMHTWLNFDGVVVEARQSLIITSTYANRTAPLSANAQQQQQSTKSTKDTKSNSSACEFCVCALMCPCVCAVQRAQTSQTDIAQKLSPKVRKRDS